jgi:hypothetical protein
MTDAEEANEILEAIVRGIDVARRKPLSDERAQEADLYAAWCATQELRRAGFVIQRNSN